MENADKRCLTRQQRAVLSALIANHPSGLIHREAVINLYINRLPSRISELKVLGITFANTWERSGNGQRFKSYKLADLSVAKALLAEDDGA